MFVKKMKLTPFYLMFLLITSCAHEEPYEHPQEDNTAVELTPQVRSSSGTEVASFGSGDKVGLYVTESSESDKGTLTPTGNIFDNLCLFYEEGNVLKPETTTHYPTGVSYVNHYVYAPYAASGITTGNLLSFTISQDQSSADKLKQADLLWGRSLKVLTTSSRPSIELDHCLSELVINLTAGNGITFSNPTVNILNTKSATSLNMGTGELAEASGEVLPITPLKQSDTTHEGIIIPQKIDAGKQLISIENAGKTYYYTLKSDKIFDAKKKYIYNITVHANDLEVEMEGIVNPWGDGGTTAEDI